MASSGRNKETGLFRTPQYVVEAVQLWNELLVEYRECARAHQTQKAKYKGLFEVWVEETMRARCRPGRGA